MLKKISNIILAFIFLFATSGITIYKHYCCERFVKQTLYIAGSDCCKGPCKCCHTEVVTLKLNDNFVSVKTGINFNDFYTNIFKNVELPSDILNLSVIKDFTSYSKNELFIWLLHPLLAESSSAYLSVFRI